MINRSLDLYKMEMGNYQLEAQPFNVVNTLLEVVNDARAIAQKDYIKVHYAAPDNAQVLGEEVLCFTLLSNLIRNAVEASSSQDTVNVGLKEQGDKVVITIRNEGVIAAEIRDSIFEKHATFGKKGGTGLGTYSAKLMAKVQHGDIDFISSQETGTIFRITLPKAPTQA